MSPSCTAGAWLPSPTGNATGRERSPLCLWVASCRHLRCVDKISSAGLGEQEELRIDEHSGCGGATRHHGLLKHKDQSSVSSLSELPFAPQGPISASVSSLSALALQGRCCPSPRRGWCLWAGHRVTQVLPPRPSLHLAPSSPSPRTFGQEQGSEAAAV